ncbi:penicillin-binding transpeptidase domain-containing protein [Bacillaceae bacterium IKA-2]|nr:penicillin-binding transpeptidase domain-containing protein [Bacillaceae bacterium IKA-2]
MLKMTKFFLLAAFLVGAVIVGCSKEEEKEPTPEEAFAEYAAFWEEANYEMMYELLSLESKEAISKEEFVRRYTNIYSAIQATDVTIKMIVDEIEIEEEEQEEQEPPTEVVLSYEQTMETLAGELYLDSDIKLLLEIEETEADDLKKWAIDWIPAMIFPHLEAGDEVRVSTLQPKRGELVDRNENGLAVNGKVIEIGIVPERLPETELATFEKVAKLLQLSVAEVESKLNQSWVQATMFVPLKSIALEEELLLAELMGIEGVTYQEIKGRVYPLSEAAAHLIGYIGPITAEELEKYSEKQYHSNSFLGKTGLESIFEDQLRGEVGGVIYIVDEAGKKKITIAEKEAIDGEIIQLTIDSDVQQSSYQQLLGDSGTAVALDPLTGEVLALVSSPAYNPNDFVLGVTSQKWQELNEDEEKPLLNRFTQAYTPGSTIKPLTAQIGIEQGWDKLVKRVIEGNAWQKDSSWGGYRISRVTDPNHDVDLHDALVYSDNIYFAQLALELGVDHFTEGFTKLGFGEALPFVYGMSTAKIANDGIMSDTQLADSGYGQGEVVISALHMALLYSSLVNEGSIAKPILLAKDAKAEIWKEGLFDSENASYILNALVDVIESPRGTAKEAEIDGLTLAGKTGTTEHKASQSEAGEETGWFIAMNTDDPELLVLMMIENVENRGGSGYVVPKVRNVFLETLRGE